MTSPENLNPPLATPDQASAVLGEVNNLMARHAAGRSLYEQEGIGAPPEVAAHFPPPHPQSTGETVSVRVLHGQGAKTDEPKREDSGATICFLHWDHRSSGECYVTEVGYTVNTGVAASIQPMERHIINYEVGSPRSKAALFSEYLAHILEAPEAAQARHDEAHAAERSAGLGDVTETEAGQILDFLKALRSEAKP